MGQNEQLTGLRWSKVRKIKEKEREKNNIEYREWIRQYYAQKGRSSRLYLTQCMQT